MSPSPAWDSRDSWHWGHLCDAPQGDGCHCRHPRPAQGISPGSSHRDSCQRGWRLLYILAAYYKCSEVLWPFLLAFLHDASRHPELPFQGRGRAHPSVLAVPWERTPRVSQGSGRALTEPPRWLSPVLHPLPVPARHRQSLRAEPEENPAVWWPQPLPQQHGAQGHGGEAGGSWVPVGWDRAGVTLRSTPRSCGCPYGLRFPLHGLGISLTQHPPDFWASSQESTALLRVCTPPFWVCPELPGVPSGQDGPETG